MRDQYLVTVAGYFDNSLSIWGGTASTFVAVVASTPSQLITQQQSPASFHQTTACDSPAIGGGFSGGISQT